MKEILLPELGEGINEVEIRDVLVKEGDFLDENQVIQEAIISAEYGRQLKVGINLNAKQIDVFDKFNKNGAQIIGISQSMPIEKNKDIMDEEDL